MCLSLPQGPLQCLLRREVPWTLAGGQKEEGSASSVTQFGGPSSSSIRQPRFLSACFVILQARSRLYPPSF